MKLPRNVSGQLLAKAPATYGYAVTRQTGGQHHLTVPDHSQLRVGTLAAIVADVAQHFGSTREEVAKRLFG